MRLLRGVRLKHRLQFTFEERTGRQFENALAENLQRLIPQAALLSELKKMGDEPSPADTVKELESTGLLTLFFPPLPEEKINYAGLSKLEKLKKSLPLAPSGWTEGWRSFFIVLTENLSAKEKADTAGTLGIGKEDLESCKKLQANAKKLETALKSPNLRKPSRFTNWFVLPRRMWCSTSFSNPPKDWCRTASAITSRSICPWFRRFPNLNFP